MSLYGYADDPAIKLSFSANNIAAEANTFECIENCVKDIIKLWMNSNQLKMSSSKSEFILFGHPKHLKRFSK